MPRALRHHPVLSALLALAELAAAVFALRLALGLMAPAAPRPAAPEGWMTPRDVARTWDLSPQAGAAALAIPQDGTGRRITLTALAAERGVNLADLIAPLSALIADAGP